MSSILDPYTAKAENHDITPHDKITQLHAIVKSCQTGMLTTRSADGSLHSRAMAPASPFTNTQLNLVFIANNSTHKFDEIEYDVHANISFLDTSSTSWASYAGTAKVSRDLDVIKKHWSSTISAYFGDLKDGIHKGDETDPRVSIIELVPDEIRLWVAKKGTAARAIDTAISSVSGNVSSPGDLITISKAEIQLTQGLHTKQ